MDTALAHKKRNSTRISVAVHSYWERRTESENRLVMMFSYFTVDLNLSFCVHTKYCKLKKKKTRLRKGGDASSGGKNTTRI